MTEKLMNVQSNLSIKKQMTCNSFGLWHICLHVICDAENYVTESQVTLTLYIELVLLQSFLFGFPKKSWIINDVCSN